jgi:hypothetical protein
VGGGGADAKGGGGAGKGASGAAGAVGGCWLISIVPLNFGAAAPFKLKPHFVQVVACSVFCVPQFGQNTRKTSHEPASISWCDNREAAGSVEEVAPGSKKNARGASFGWQFAGFHVPTTDMEELHDEKNTSESSHGLTRTGVDH